MSPIPQTPLGWDELWEEASPEAEIKGAGAKAPECTIAAARRVGRKTKCLVSVLTERNNKIIIKTKNVAKALLVLCDKAKNIRVGSSGLLTF